MSLIVLTSAGRSPGTTTTAVGLAVTWPAPVLLVDADRQPSQSVLAGYLHGADARGRGLGGVLQAHRERRPLESVLRSLHLPLTAEDEARSFLPGFAHPGMVGLFGPVWSELVPALAATGGDVLIDAGRIGVDGLPPALVSAADAVLVVTRSALVDLVALRLYLPLLADAGESQRLGLLLVGEGRPYASGEIAQQFGVDVWAGVAWSPVDAAVYSDGALPARRVREGAYARSVAKVAGGLAQRVEQARLRIGVPQ